MQSWKERTARFPQSSIPAGVQTPGEGETILSIWQGVGLITGRCQTGEAAARLMDDFPIFNVPAEYTLENLVEQARIMVLDESRETNDRGYDLAYRTLLEPFCFLADYERKDEI